MHAGLPAGRLHRAVFLVSSLGSAVSQKLMLSKELRQSCRHRNAFIVLFCARKSVLIHRELFLHLHRFFSLLTSHKQRLLLRLKMPPRPLQKCPSELAIGGFPEGPELEV